MPVRFNSSDSLRADKPRTDGALQVDDSGPYDSAPWFRRRPSVADWGW